MLHFLELILKLKVLEPCKLSLTHYVQESVLNRAILLLIELLLAFSLPLSPPSHHAVNIVPVIAKSDTLTKKELIRLKQRVMNEINGHGIQTYDIPECEVDEDEDFKRQNQQLREAIPFAVCGANQIIEVRGKKVRGRMYPWGVVEGILAGWREKERGETGECLCDWRVLFS